MIYLDGKAFETLHEVEIECEQGREEGCVEYLQSGSFSMECKCDGNVFLKAFLGKGRYNAYILRRDGYLSERNGWI